MNLKKTFHCAINYFTLLAGRRHDGGAVGALGALHFAEGMEVPVRQCEAPRLPEAPVSHAEKGRWKLVPVTA